MVVLPAPEGPTNATSSPGLRPERHVDEDVLVRIVSGAAPRLRDRACPPRRRPAALERGQAPPPSAAGYAKLTWSNSTDAGPRGMAVAPGFSLTDRLEVEHLEDPLERDQRGGDVHPDVRQRRQRAEEPAEVGGQGDKRTHVERAADWPGRRPSRRPARWPATRSASERRRTPARTWPGSRRCRAPVPARR